MDITESNVEDEHWNIGAPVYYVTFWTEDDPDQWCSQSFRIANAEDIDEVTRWADSFTATMYQVAVESPDDVHGRIWVKGKDPSGSNPFLI